MKRASIKNHYSAMTERLKVTNPRKFYSMMHEICDPYHQKKGDFEIESIRNKSVSEQADLIAMHFAKISQTYEPVNFSKLPTYLPSQKPPQVTEIEVFQKLKKLKNTLSTHPIDLPQKLRREYSIF